MGRFGLKCAMFFAPLVGLLALAAVSLSIVGEMTTPEHVLALQRSAPVLFEQMYQPKNDYPAYKVLGVRENRPRVLALGTSRIFSLRHEFVRESAGGFYNGYIFSAPLGAMRKFLERLSADQLPHALILDIDPWWFDEHAEIEPPPDYFEYPSQMEILDFAWRNGLYLLTQQWAMRSPPNLIGGSARLNKSGLRADGSSYPNFRRFDRIPHLLEKELHDVREGTDINFLRGSQTVSSAAVEEMQKLLDFCSTHHILLIGYLSTFHPSVYKTLQEIPSDAYIWHVAPILTARFQKADALLFDFQNPSEVGCSASEYLDPGHESEVCTARILVAMARRDSRAASLFDADKLQRLLSHRPSDWQLGL